MQATNNKLVTVGDLLEKFDLSNLAENGKLNSLYQKALNSLVAFAGNVRSCPLKEIDKLICDWIVSLRVRDLALKTASDYLMSMSGIYSRAEKSALLPATEVFIAIRAWLKEKGGELWKSGVHLSDFESFRRLVRAELAKKESENMGADIMLLSLLNGCIPVVDIARWKKDDALADNAAPGILSRVLTRSGREYLFPLKHGKRTPKQFAGDVNELVLGFLSSHNVRTFGDADSTILSYWGFAALRAGVDTFCILSAIRSIPEGLSFLSLANEKFSGEQFNVNINPLANSMFVNAPMRWYAMHLRPRVTFDDLVRRFADERGIRMPETFYPTQEMARHIGKKVIFEEQPFIHNVVFFKSHYDEILPMFNRIGDMAWCYKTTMGVGGTYAPIHQKSLDEFQRAIGCFTPEFMAANRDEETIVKGDIVRITGGNCLNLEGRIKEVEPAGPEGILTYLIEICNGYARSFTAKVDSRQVQKIPALD